MKILRNILGILTILVLCGFGGAPSGGSGGGGAPSGAAGGDLSGTYPNPTVAQVNGHAPTTSPVANQFATSSDSSGRLTLAQPAFSNLSGNLGITQLPNVQIIGTPTTATGTATATLTVNTVTGTQGTDTLYLCGVALAKPTSAISCPGSWTALATGGQVADGTSQTQAALCACLAGTCTSGSYAFTWTGNAFAGGTEIALRGLTQSTTADATYSGGNNPAAQFLKATITGTYQANDLQIICAGASGNTGVVTSPAPLLQAGNGEGIIGLGFGGFGESSVSLAASPIQAIAGASQH